MLIFIYFWLFISYVLMFAKPRLGIALYIPFFILIPYLNNLVYLNYPIILALLYLHAIEKKRLNIKWFVPFFIYFLLFLILIPAQSGLSLSKQFNYWRLDLFGFLSLPLFISYILKIDKDSINIFRNSMIFCILVSTIYGLLLTRLDGINPYLLYMSYITGIGDKNMIMDYSMAEGAGRMFGRIFSCFQHPMLYAYFLGLSTIYLYHCRKKINQILLLTLYILLALNMVFCGVRSVIGGLAIAAAFYLLVGKKYKLLIYLGIAYLTFIKFSDYLPYLRDYFGSFMGDSSNSEIKGSSIEMRLKQFEGCLNEIQSSPIVGKGYGWARDYLAHKGDHPVMLAFESLVFSLLCNAGIMGVVIWGIFFLLFSRLCIKNLRNSVVYISTLVFYLAFSVITGDYSYMKFFVLFFILMVGEGDKKLKVSQQQLKQSQRINDHE